MKHDRPVRDSCPLFSNNRFAEAVTTYPAFRGLSASYEVAFAKAITMMTVTVVSFNLLR